MTYENVLEFLSIDLFETCAAAIIIVSVFIFLFLSLIPFLYMNTEEKTKDCEPEHDSVVHGKRVLRIIWMMTLWPATGGTIATILTGNFLWLLLALTTVAMLRKGFDTIVSDPPSFGVMTFWNTRYNIVFNEGTKLMADYFPFYIGFIPIETKKINANLTFKDVRCRLKEEGDDGTTRSKAKSGGEVIIDASLTFKFCFILLSK
jgi:hypothetical protein